MRSGWILGAISASLCLSVSASAGNWATGEGSCYRKGIKMVGTGGSVLPFGGFVSFDYGLLDAISLGGATGFNTTGHSRYWRYNKIPILVRGGFHPFNLSVIADKIKIREKLDVYAGLAAGWGIGFWSFSGSGPTPDHPDRLGLILREYIGAKFFITPNFAFMLEDCHGLGLLNAGVCFAF